MSVSTEFKELVKLLETDPELREAWKANIAVPFQDEVSRFKKRTGKTSLSKSDIHEIANNAADEFLTILCR